MSLGPDGFVILFLSTLIPFSGALNLSVNQALSIDKEMKKPFPLAPHFSAIIPCKHLGFPPINTICCLAQRLPCDTIIT